MTQKTTCKSATSVAMALLLFLTLACCAQTKLATAQEDGKKGDVATFFNLSNGFSKIVRAPKTNDKSPLPQRAQRRRENLPIPRSTGVLLTAPSLKRLDAAASDVFAGSGSDRFSVLGALFLTDYRKVLAEIDQEAPVGLYVFCQTVPPSIAVALPVDDNDADAFLDALAKASKGAIPKKNGANYEFSVKLPEETRLCARQIDPDYLVVTSEATQSVLNEFARGNLVPISPSGAPPAFKSPCLTLEASPAGIAQLTDPYRPFWREVDRLVYQAKMAAPPIADVEFDAVRQYVADNIASVRYDLDVDEYGIYAGLQTRPRPNSDSQRELASYRDPSPINLAPDRIFSILPSTIFALAGQMDIPEELAKKLPKPFNRVKFVEYSFGLPAPNQLAADSWLFYLEVDDSEQFAREMIIPKAREIGRYVGSKQGGEAASQLLGKASEARLERQKRRGVPARRLADPERAAALGNALGSALGGLIGENQGEEIAMKEQRINGYKTYISDLETFSRQSALMRAEQEGKNPRRGSPLAKNDFSLVETLVSVLDGSDDIQSSMLRSINDDALNVDDSPLLARTGYLVMLDKNTILYSLGNESLLRYGINNYRATTSPGLARYQALADDSDAVQSLIRLISQIPNVERANTVGSALLDPAAAQAYYRWLQGYYIPNAPVVNSGLLPSDTPKMLALFSVDRNLSIQRFLTPHRTIENVLKTYFNTTLLELVLANRQAENDSAESDGDVEIDFND